MDVKGVLFGWENGKKVLEAWPDTEGVLMESLSEWWPNSSLAMIGEAKAPAAKLKCRACR